MFENGGLNEPSWESAATEEELAKIEEFERLAQNAHYGDGRVLFSDGKLDPNFVNWQKENYGSRRYSSNLDDQKTEYLLDMRNQLVSSIEARQAAESEELERQERLSKGNPNLGPYEFAAGGKTPMSFMNKKFR